jgi:predicted RNA-binding Zn-ribbon protein involved in translation (DUF1610 family)
MNGIEFFAHLNGKFVPDEDKITEQMVSFAKEYPFGDVNVSNDRLLVYVDCKPDGDGLLCMTCGTKLENRVNQVCKNGQWQAMKRKNHISHWECPKCGLGAQPIRSMMGTGKIIK